jgi:hypothetical protein
MRGFAALFIAVALAGCTGTRFSQQNPPRVVTVCPQIKTYSATEQAAARAEMRAGASPTLNVLVNDYFGLRQQVRACKEKNK